jgi:hypothetical protein
MLGYDAVPVSADASPPSHTMHGSAREAAALAAAAGDYRNPFPVPPLHAAQGAGLLYAFLNAVLTGNGLLRLRTIANRAWRQLSPSSPSTTPGSAGNVTASWQIGCCGIVLHPTWARAAYPVRSPATNPQFVPRTPTGLCSHCAASVGHGVRGLSRQNPG